MNKKVEKKEGQLFCIDEGNEPLHTFHVDHHGELSLATQFVS